MTAVSVLGFAFHQALQRQFYFIFLMIQKVIIYIYQTTERNVI